MLHKHWLERFRSELDQIIKIFWFWWRTVQERLDSIQTRRRIFIFEGLNLVLNLDLDLYDCLIIFMVLYHLLSLFLINPKPFRQKSSLDQKNRICQKFSDLCSCNRSQSPCDRSQVTWYRSHVARDRSLMGFNPETGRRCLRSVADGSLPRDRSLVWDR